MDKWLKLNSKAGTSREESADVESIESNITSNSSYETNEKIISRERKIKRYYRFRQEWLELECFKNWLKKSDKPKDNNIEYAFCKLCNMDIFPNKNDIYRHSKREKHIWRSGQVSKCTDISDIAKMAQTPKFDAVKYAEIKLAGFVAYCNLPFTVMDTLTTVCSDIFKDSPVAKALTCKRTKATTIIRENSGKYFREELFAVLRKPGMFFSLIMDETTDIGTVIFFSEIDDRVITKFFDMLEVESGKADDLYKVLKTSNIKRHPF
ncbi:uncharacterized protein [Leptinotarsa decemlineata]|uniref:uncharacterized protein n=1 Tax=Leptinotarsa decemlineata TaxID=7539 RepID=UPI003D308852